jgi:Eco57I restriction-modification methylase
VAVPPTSPEVARTHRPASSRNCASTLEAFCAAGLRAASLSSSSTEMASARSSSTRDKVQTKVSSYSAKASAGSWSKSLPYQPSRSCLRHAAVAGVSTATKFDAFAYFIVHAVSLMQPDSRLGFVTSAAWLTSQYGAQLQRFILENMRPVAVLWSEAEPFFAAQEVNTVVLIAAVLKSKTESRGNVRFVTLTKPLTDLFGREDGDYWARVDSVADALEVSLPRDYGDYRITIIDADAELAALRDQPTRTRNWARPLRATAVYEAVFGEV